MRHVWYYTSVIYKNCDLGFLRRSSTVSGLILSWGLMSVEFLCMGFLRVLWFHLPVMHDGGLVTVCVHGARRKTGYTPCVSVIFSSGSTASLTWIKLILTINE